MQEKKILNNKYTFTGFSNADMYTAKTKKNIQSITFGDKVGAVIFNDSFPAKTKLEDFCISYIDGDKKVLITIKEPKKLVKGDIRSDIVYLFNYKDFTVERIANNIDK